MAAMCFSIGFRWSSSVVVSVVLCLQFVDPSSGEQQALQQGDSQNESTVSRLGKLGATVFQSNGHVVEVNANGKKITDDDLKAVGEFVRMTDLSLEETAITDKGLAHLTKLQKLEWLNLYSAGAPQR
jgi:hypothetical protein